MKYIKILFKLVIGYPLYFISGFIPRNNKIWVFGSFGIFNDNSRYLYEYVVKNPQYGIRAIWLSNNLASIQEARKYGEAYNTISLKGLYFSLVAKVYIFSSYISNINYFTSRKAVSVNLWHGVPLKKIEFDIETKPLVKVFKEASVLRKIITPEVHLKSNFILSPSQYVADYSFKSAFQVKDENIIVAKYPRVSYLQECEPLLEYLQYKKVFLYTPTWRDDGRDFLSQAGFDFVKLNALMESNNSIFVMKFHSATKLDINLSVYKNLQVVANNIDPIRLMKSADCLITDYSSIYFDYLYLDRPIIYFCFDLEEYLFNREMYFEYADVVAGIKVEKFMDLYEKISDILAGYDKGCIRRNYIKDVFLTNNENNVEKIVKSIQTYVS